MPAVPEFTLTKLQAESSPEPSAPAAMSITAAGRSVPEVNSSWRDHATRTGLPTCRASTAASVATPPACLPPNPEPVGGTITRTWCSSMPSAAAT